MRPHGKYAIVDPNNPQAFGQCDRCGFWFNLRDLQWQEEWGGTRIFNTRVLVCTGNNCLDVVQEQLRSIVLPPDPYPVLNARVPDFAYEEYTVMIAQDGDPGGPPWAAGPQLILCDQSGEIPLILQYPTSLYGTPPPYGFELDVSKLDGPDVL